MRYARGLLLVMVSCVCLTGCISPKVLGQLEGMRLEDDLLQRADNVGRLERALVSTAQPGRALLGVVLVVLCFVSWYRATHGTPWVAFVKDWLLGLFVATMFLSTSATAGPVFGIYKMGRTLAEGMRPPGTAETALETVAVNSGLVMIALQAPGQTGASAAAWASFVISNPALTFLVGINTLASYMIKMVLHVGYVFLLCFYWIVGPLVAPLVVLPQTRPIFVGWLKSLIAVALWPVFFAVIETMLTILPWANWLPISEGGIGAIVSGDLLVKFLQTQFMLVVLNFVFLFVYGAVPLVAGRIVSGAGSPFKTAAG